VLLRVRDAWRYPVVGLIWLLIVTLLPLVTLALLPLYVLWFRPWHLRWGATDEEVARSMPGDEVVQDATFNATRAVSIQARPEEIWPWLVQIGCMRAGWYTYDWIDNLGYPSADRIVPELQGLKVGDVVPISPDGKQGLRVKALEPPRWMVWWDPNGRTTWAWGLYPTSGGPTRLVSRVRIRYSWRSPWILFHLLLDVGDIVMMRKCLLTLKQRAEGLALRSGQRKGQSQPNS